MLILSMVPTDEKEYLSYVAIANVSDVLYPTKLLNTILVNNFTQHKLVLKIGAPVMLIKLCHMADLFNGS